MKYRIIRRQPIRPDGAIALIKDFPYEPWCEADNIGLLEAIIGDISLCQLPWVYKIIDRETGEVQD